MKPRFFVGFCGTTEVVPFPVLRDVSAVPTARSPVGRRHSRRWKRRAIFCRPYGTWFLFPYFPRTYVRAAFYRRFAAGAREPVEFPAPDQQEDLSGYKAAILRGALAARLKWCPSRFARRRRMVRSSMHPKSKSKSPP